MNIIYIFPDVAFCVLSYSLFFLVSLTGFIYFISLFEEPTFCFADFFWCISAFHWFLHLFYSSFYLLPSSTQVFIASWIRSLIFNLSLALIHGIKDKNFSIKTALATSDKLWCIIFLFSFSSKYFKISIVFSSLINGLYRPILLSF